MSHVSRLSLDQALSKELVCLPGKPELAGKQAAVQLKSVLQQYHATNTCPSCQVLLVLLLYVVSSEQLLLGSTPHPGNESMGNCVPKLRSGGVFT